MKRADQENRIQAEIAGGALASPHQAPAIGQYLRPFSLPSIQGGTIALSDYRGRAALVIILSDSTPAAEALMNESARHYAEIRKKDAEVLAILCDSREQRSHPDKRLELPFPVLLDESAKVHRQLGATSSAVVYVADRFGEVFAAWHATGGNGLPGIGEILNRLDFISFQCPECEPPEWPA